MRIEIQDQTISKRLLALRGMRSYHGGVPLGRRSMLQDQEDRPEAVGARLKRVREILGLEQNVFAARAGLLPQTYGPFELGRRSLSLDAAKKLRKTYGLSLEFMYFGKIEDLPHRISASL